LNLVVVYAKKPRMKEVQHFIDAAEDCERSAAKVKDEKQKKIFLVVRHG